MAKILLVEDDRQLSRSFVDLIKNSINLEVVPAYSLEEAKEKIENLIFEISIIILDACLDSYEPNSMPLITQAREAGFKGPIIACSSCDYYNDILLENGATHKVMNGKLSVLKTLKEILQK